MHRAKQLITVTSSLLWKKKKLGHQPTSLSHRFLLAPELRFAVELELALFAVEEPRLALAEPSFLTVLFFFLKLRNPLPLSCREHVVR